MFHGLRWLLAPAVLVAWLSAAGTVSAAPINDNAGFFSPKAVENAEAEIAALHRKYDKELKIETFAEIPAERKKDYNADEKAKFFDKWARQRATELKVDGIYILICKSPSYLEVEVGNKTEKAGFSPAERKKLRDKLVERFKDKEYDKGLAETVEYVGDRYATHFKDKETATTSQSGGSATPNRKGGGLVGNWMGLICVGVLLLLGVWVVIGLIRAMSGGGGYGGGYGGY